jgi:hypothetical protein
MVRRDELGRMFVVDGNGHERVASTDGEMRTAVEAVLDDPSIPQAEQLGNLEYAAEKILVEATAAFLPEVARPLAAPLVRDVASAMRKLYEFPENRAAQRAMREPTHERAARARTHRIRSSKLRLGGSIKRRGDAA